MGTFCVDGGFVLITLDVKSVFERILIYSSCSGGGFSVLPLALFFILIPAVMQAQFAPDPSIGRNLPDSIPEAPPDAFVRRPSELEIKPDYADVRIIGTPGSGILREIVFSGALSPADRKQVVGPFPELHIDRVDLLASERRFLASLRDSFVNKPFNLAVVREISRLTLHFYFKHERPLVFVQPASIDYEHGILTITVVEATIGKKTETGAKWFSKKLLLSSLRASVGQYLNRMGLLNDVAILNQNPFMHNSAVLQRGDSPGTTTLDLRTQDRFPLRSFLSIDNTGSQQTGPLRWSAGANWGNAFFLGGQLSYQYSAPFAYPNAQPVQSLSYSTPLPWKHLFTLYGNYSVTDTGISTPAGSLSYSGYQAQISPRYTIPIGKMYGKLIQNLTLGGDWKSSNLYFVQGGDQVPSNQTDVIQSVVGYQLQTKDKRGESSASVDLYWAPGNIDSRNTQQSFVQVDPRTHPNYLYTSIRLSRENELPLDCSLLALFTGQLASTSLPTTEQLSIGGYGTVRGYQQQILFGDQGCYGSLELHSPFWSILNGGKSPPLRDKLMFLAFWDYGLVNTIQPLPGNASSYAISGAGFGVRYTLGLNYSLRCDLGFPLINPNVAGVQIAPTVALGASVSF